MQLNKVYHNSVKVLTFQGDPYSANQAPIERRADNSNQDGLPLSLQEKDRRVEATPYQNGAEKQNTLGEETTEQVIKTFNSFFLINVQEDKYFDDSKEVAQNGN